MRDDEKKTVASRWLKSGKFRKCNWITCSWETRAKEDVGILGCERKGDEGCAQYGGSEEDDGRMDLPKTDGVALKCWIGVCGHHREVRQRTGVDKFDCIVEHDDDNDERIKDDHRERAIQSVQGMFRTIRSDIEGRWRVQIGATHSMWPWIAEHAGLC